MCTFRSLHYTYIASFGQIMCAPWDPWGRNLPPAPFGRFLAPLPAVVDLDRHVKHCRKWEKTRQHKERRTRQHPKKNTMFPGKLMTKTIPLIIAHSELHGVYRSNN